MKNNRIFKPMLLSIAIIEAFIFLNASIATSSERDNMTAVIVGIDRDSRKEVYLHQHNGRAWNKYDHNEKVAFIFGMRAGVDAMYVYSGLSTMPDFNKYNKYRQSFYGGSFKATEISDIIDDIYSDKSNIIIPIVDVVRCAVEKTKGISKGDFDMTLSELRRKFNVQK